MFIGCFNGKDNFSLIHIRIEETEVNYPDKAICGESVSCDVFRIDKLEDLDFVECNICRSIFRRKYKCLL